MLPSFNDHVEEVLNEAVPAGFDNPKLLKEVQDQIIRAFNVFAKNPQDLYRAMDVGNFLISSGKESVDITGEPFEYNVYVRYGDAGNRPPATQGTAGWKAPSREAQIVISAWFNGEMWQDPEKHDELEALVRNQVQTSLDHEIAHIQRILAPKGPGFAGEYPEQYQVPGYLRRKAAGEIGQRDYQRFSPEWDATVTALVRGYERMPDEQKATIHSVVDLFNALYGKGHPRTEDFLKSFGQDSIKWQRRTLSRLNREGVPIRRWGESFEAMVASLTEGKRICAWCGKELGEWEGEGESHGICDDCAKKLYGEMGEEPPERLKKDKKESFESLMSEHLDEANLQRHQWSDYAKQLGTDMALLRQSVAQVDPTQDRTKYASWIVKQMIAFGDSWQQAAEYTAGLLDRYEQLKARKKLTPEHTDLDRAAPSVEALSNLLGQYPEGAGTTQQALDSAKASIQSDGGRVVAEGGPWLVVQLPDEKAASYVGHGGGWCIKDKEWFSFYNFHGPLYIVFSTERTEPYKPSSYDNLRFALAINARKSGVAEIRDATDLWVTESWFEKNDPDGTLRQMLEPLTGSSVNILANPHISHHTIEAEAKTYFEEGVARIAQDEIGAASSTDLEARWSERGNQEKQIHDAAWIFSNMPRSVAAVACVNAAADANVDLKIKPDANRQSGVFVYGPTEQIVNEIGPPHILGVTSGDQGYMMFGQNWLLNQADRLWLQVNSSDAHWSESLESFGSLVETDDPHKHIASEVKHLLSEWPNYRPEIFYEPEKKILFVSAGDWEVPENGHMVDGGYPDGETVHNLLSKIDGVETIEQESESGPSAEEGSFVKITPWKAGHPVESFESLLSESPNSFPHGWLINGEFVGIDGNMHIDYAYDKLGYGDYYQDEEERHTADVWEDARVRRWIRLTNDSTGFGEGGIEFLATPTDSELRAVQDLLLESGTTLKNVAVDVEHRAQGVVPLDTFLDFSSATELIHYLRLGGGRALNFESLLSESNDPIIVSHFRGKFPDLDAVRIEWDNGDLWEYHVPTGMYDNIVRKYKKAGAQSVATAVKQAAVAEYKVEDSEFPWLESMVVPKRRLSEMTDSEQDEEANKMLKQYLSEPTSIWLYTDLPVKDRVAWAYLAADRFKDVPDSEDFLKKFIEALKLTVEDPETFWEQIREKDAKRADYLDRGDWKLETVSLESIGVYPKFSGFNDEYCTGSVLDTAEKIKGTKEYTLKRSRLMDMSEKWMTITKFLPPILVPGGTLRGRHDEYEEKEYDVDDGNHRLVAAALAGATEAICFVSGGSEEKKTEESFKEMIEATPQSVIELSEGWYQPKTGEFIAVAGETHAHVANRVLGIQVANTMALASMLDAGWVRVTEEGFNVDPSKVRLSSLQKYIDANAYWRAGAIIYLDLTDASSLNNYATQMHIEDFLRARSWNAVRKYQFESIVEATFRDDPSFQNISQLLSNYERWLLQQIAIQTEPEDAVEHGVGFAYYPMAKLLQPEKGIQTYEDVSQALDTLEYYGLITWSPEENAEGELESASTEWAENGLKLAEYEDMLDLSHEDDSPQDILERAVELFGTTDDPREAGFILPDGIFLDFSGMRQGSMAPGRRYMDHNEVGSLPGVDGHEEFCAQTGAVRMGLAGDYVFFDMRAEPSYTQQRVMMNIMSEYTDYNADIEALQGSTRFVFDHVDNEADAREAIAKAVMGFKRGPEPEEPEELEYQPDPYLQDLWQRKATGESLAERRSNQPQEIYWHGTSSEFLPSILSKGLVPIEDPEKKAWGSDPDREGPEGKSAYLSRRSYGGTYLTKNFGQAITSASRAVDKFPGTPVMVAVQISPHSLTADEDDVVYKVEQAYNDAVGYHGYDYHFALTYLEALQNPEAHAKYQKAFEGSLISAVQSSMSTWSGQQQELPAPLVDRVRQVMQGMFLDYAGMKASVVSDYDFRRAWAQLNSGQGHEGWEGAISLRPNKDEEEAKIRTTADQLTRTLATALTGIDKSFATGRMLDPVDMAGRNRILAIYAKQPGTERNVWKVVYGENTVDLERAFYTYYSNAEFIESLEDQSVQMGLDLCLQSGLPYAQAIEAIATAPGPLEEANLQQHQWEQYAKKLHYNSPGALKMFVEAIDPTGRRLKYASWIVKEFVRRWDRDTEYLEMNYPPDAVKDWELRDKYLKELLTSYDRLKKKKNRLPAEYKDIEKVKNPYELRQIILQSSDPLEQIEQDGGEIVYQDEGDIIVRVTTPTAAGKLGGVGLGRGKGEATWCTRMPSKAAEYMEDGNLYFIYAADPGTYVLESPYKDLYFLSAFADSSPHAPTGEGGFEWQTAENEPVTDEWLNDQNGGKIYTAVRRFVNNDKINEYFAYLDGHPEEEEPEEPPEPEPEDYAEAQSAWLSVEGYGEFESAIVEQLGGAAAELLAHHTIGATKMNLLDENTEEYVQGLVDALAEEISPQALYDLGTDADEPDWEYEVQQNQYGGLDIQAWIPESELRDMARSLTLSDIVERAGLTEDHIKVLVWEYLYQPVFVDLVFDKFNGDPEATDLWMSVPEDQEYAVFKRAMIASGAESDPGLNWLPKWDIVTAVEAVTPELIRRATIPGYEQNVLRGDAQQMRLFQTAPEPPQQEHPVLELPSEYQFAANEHVLIDSTNDPDAWPEDEQTMSGWIVADENGMPKTQTFDGQLYYLVKSEQTGESRSIDPKFLSKPYQVVPQESFESMVQGVLLN